MVLKVHKKRIVANSINVKLVLIVIVLFVQDIIKGLCQEKDILWIRIIIF